MMIAMPEIRSFPRTKTEPTKRILLIPIILIVLGYLMLVKWWIFGILPLQFVGAILALTGGLSIFLVGMVFADLWAAHRRTKIIIEAREEKGLPSELDEDQIEDPFEETLNGD
jgi:small-conductance mechanosensitive channel